MMPELQDWQDLARKLDWEFSYVDEHQVYPEAMSGTPWLEHKHWQDWEEPFRTTYGQHVCLQHEKELSVLAVRDAVGHVRNFEELPKSWLSSLKFYAAALPLAEFAAVVGNLRAARFGRDSAWRTMSAFGALDELRHTQIPLALMESLVKWDPQFDWAHRFYHSKNWISIAARHLFDELLLGANPIEFALGTNFVFETGFTNLQFVGLSSLAQEVGDDMFAKMLMSIQTDEARHAQIGPAVLSIICRHDPKYAQYMLDKWFWRSWLLFAVLTGFSMDYFTPLSERKQSFKEFMQEWILDQYLDSLQEYGLKKPWYWDQFLQSLDSYHHMVYASAYTHRATTWFDFVVPSPEERQWLREKYPASWPEMEPVWEQIDRRWEKSDPGTEWGVHGATPVAFCHLCQLVLCQGTPQKNLANTLTLDGEHYIFCSEPCRWIFMQEPERYRHHKDVVKRILTGEAPSNLLELVRGYFGLSRDIWGKDIQTGNYSWLKRDPVQSGGGA